MAGVSQVLGPGPHWGDLALSPGVTGAGRAVEPAGASFPGSKEALGALLGPEEEGLQGEGAGHLLEPCAAGRRELLLLSGGFLPSLESLKNNLHRMSHLICLSR